MEDKDLLALFEILETEGIFSSPEEMQSVIDAEGIEVLYDVIPKGIFNSPEEFVSAFPTVKKKDNSQPIGEEEVMVSDTEVVEQPGSSEPSVQINPEEVISDPSLQPNIDQTLDEAPTPFQFEEEVPADITEEVMYDPREKGHDADAEITYSSDATAFDRSLAYITPDLIEREEEEVVNRMIYHFNDYGFEFEETGTEDGMIVTADNGEVLRVTLDPALGLGSDISSKKLQQFLQENKVSTPEMDELTYENDLNRKKYFTRESVDAEIDDVRSKANDLGDRYKEYLKESNNNQTQIDLLLENKSLNSEQTAQYDTLIEEKKELNNDKVQLQKEHKNFQTFSNQIERSVGDYISMKEDDGNGFGTVVKGMYNNFVTSGITKVISSLWGGGVDGWYGLMQSINEDFGMTPEEKKERYVTIAKDLGYTIPKNIEDDGVYNTWLDGLMKDGFDGDAEEGDIISAGFPKEIQAQLITEGFDPSKTVNARGFKMWNNEGGLLGTGGYETPPDYAFDKSKGKRLRRLVLDQEVKENKNPQKQLIRDGLRWLAAEGVSDEKIAKMSEDSFVYEGLFGLAESGPSILLGLLGPGKGKAAAKGAKWGTRVATGLKNYLKSPGAMAQTASFSLLQTDALMQEMENDPDFKYVTETEKKAITLPLAVTTAILERYGLRNIATNKTIVSGLMRQVTKMLPKGATPKMFTDALSKIVSNNVARGIFKVGGAAVAEAETGGLQQITEIGMKTVWNDMKGKDMFKVPEMWSEEFSNQVVRAALAESVGGFVMGTPGALVTAFDRGQIDEISDGMIKLFNEIRKDEVTVRAYKTQLDLKVVDGSMTKEEAAKELLNFEVLSSAAETVSTSSELNDEQTKKAIGLVFLRNKVENEMSGMDPDLGTYKQKQEILEKIKDKLSKIGTEQEESANLKEKKDAIQEPSTEKVDVQESSESSKEVGDGNTEGNITEEGLENKNNTEAESQEEVSLDDRAEQIDNLVSEEQEDSQTEPQPIPTEQLEEIDDVISINKSQQESVEQNPMKEGVMRRVGKAAKALKKVIPNLKIIMHESTGDFKKATGKSGRGARTQDGILHINLEKATNSTVAHEAFHIVLLSKLGTDLEAQRVTKRMMESISKALPESDPLRKKIDAFAKEYDSNLQNEERLSELLGELSANYTTLSAPQKGVIRKWVDRIMRGMGMDVSEFTKSDQDVVDLLNTLASKVTAGIEVEEGDVSVIEEIKEDISSTEQGAGGEVGTIKVREQKDSNPAPKAESDTRPFSFLVKNKDIADFEGKPFVTNMYDFTTAGPIDLGNGNVINLFGGKSYVPFMMERQGLKIGEVSNLAAFNTKSQAEGFIRNSEQGNANLFMPHAGTVTGSWQFQQSIFESLVNTVLDNKILSKKEIISTFNEVLNNAVGKKSFAQFKKKYGKNIKNFNSFINNPLEIIELLNTDNNYSPDLRKALNDKLSANKKFQKAIGVKSKAAFSLKMEDPLNKGVESGDLMGVVEFDNSTFEINKPKKEDADYHPSFAWTVKAKIKGIYQPTNFQKSYDVTDSYTKYNQSGPEVSISTVETKKSFIKSNVSSSAGSIPKVAKVSKVATREQKVVFKIEKQRVYKDNSSGVTFLTKGYGGTFINIPRKAVTIKDTDGLSESQKPLVEVTMDKNIYDKQDQARKVVDGNESFVNELETIKGFDSTIATREQKDQSKTVEKLANFYAMDEKGFIKPENVYDLDALKQWASRVGFTVKRHRGDSGATTMYSLLNANDKKFTPVKGTARTRFQKIMDKFDNPIHIINLAREAGFTNKEISYFLKTKKGLKVKEIKDLMSVDINMFESMPEVFGNIPGGLVVGRKLYEATMNKFKSLVSKNSKLAKGKQRSISDLINESIEFMTTLKAYKDSTEGVRSKTKLSTLQQQLQIEMQEALGGNAVKDISKTITNLKKIIRQKIRGAREIRDVKRQLQRAIREIMPKAEYTKGEVTDLLRTIQEAEPAWLKGNLRNLIQKIEKLGAKKNVSILEKAILKILDKKFLVKIGGVETVVKIDGKTAKIIQAIKDKIYKGVDISEDIIEEQSKIMDAITKLSEKLELTEQEQTDLLVLNIALGINNSKLMEDDNPRKADQLADLYNDLKALITIGRNNFKDAAKKRSDRYAKNTSDFYKALTNGKESLDLRDDEVVAKIEKDLKDKATIEASPYGKSKIALHFQNIGKKVGGFLKMGTLGLSQLSSELDKAPGAQFDGFIKDFIYRKVNQSTRMYKESIMALDQIIDEKSREYLGEDYQKKIKEYRKALDFTKIEDGKLFKDPKAVKEAQEKFDNDKTKENEKNLNETIILNTPFVNITPLQLQYLYFQYKQNDTHSGFATALGENYEGVMSGLNKYFEENYSDLLELGQWQVDVLLPSLYEKYNKVYKERYNTDMPQRDNYSGRTFRLITDKGQTSMEKNDPLSLFGDDGTSKMGMNVIGNSTKLTVKNNNEIMPVDAFTAIDVYLKDMEHFAAYSENINDISKVFFNPIIKKTIISQHGQEVYDAIKHSLMATAQRGANQSDKVVEMVNKTNSIFIVQKLGAGLTVYLKQLTSIATYGNYIGYRNWTKTLATMGPKEFKKAWEEISEDSVYIKHRYWEQISRSIESYGEKQMQEYTPGNKGDEITQLMMSPIKAGDKQAIFIGGIPNYVFLRNKFIKDGMPEDAAKKKALLMFEEQTKEVQQSSDKQDKDMMQNTGGLIQTFNMFMSAPKAYLRQIFGGYRELGRNLKDGSGKGTSWQNSRQILLYQFAMPMIFQWAGSGFPITDWDDEDKKDQARAAILSVFNSIFVLGQILEMGADYASGKPWWDQPKQFPIIDLVQDAIKQYDRTNATDPEKATEAWKQFVFTLLPLTSLGGVPGNVASLPLKTLDRMRLNMRKLIKNGGDPKEVFLRLFNYSDYVIDGPEEKKEKTPKLRKSEIKKYLPELQEEIDGFNSDPDMKEFNKQIKEFKKEKESIRKEFLKEMYED